MLKNLSPLLCILCIFIYSCKTVKVDEDNFAWKSYNDTLLDQSVNLREYASPNDRPGQDQNRVVIFCASGGGSRAAAFNMGIMLELEKISYKQSSAKIDSAPDDQKNILNEIDYFSTVSGGGWGVSSFIAYKYQKQKYSSDVYQNAILKYNESLTDSSEIKELKIDNFPTFNSYEKYLTNRADFRYFKHQWCYLFSFGLLNKASDRTMTNRLNAGYLGWSYRNDIEQRTWGYIHGSSSEFNSNNVDEIMLGDIFKPKDKVATLPMQIANSTNIDNYKLIPFTPDRLRYWGVGKYIHYLNKMTTLPNTKSLLDYDSIPLASGTKASSGIPFLVTSSVFPAVKKTNSKSDDINYYLHLQDGGIVDQQAMHTAKAILNRHDNIKDRKNRVVFIVDASSTGIENKKKFKKPKAGRFYNLWRVIAPFSTPDAQYALTRERVKLFEKEYNCTVIYLGTEVLLDEGLNPKQLAGDTADTRLPIKKHKVEEYFYSQYKSVKNNTSGFLDFNMKQRKLLFEYVSKFEPTWFASKRSKYKGKYIVDDPKSSAQIMFLAGRGVVQLKRDIIIKLLSN